MENDGHIVGLDAPTAKSKMVKLDNRDRRLDFANFRPLGSSFMSARPSLEKTRWRLCVLIFPKDYGQQHSWPVFDYRPNNRSSRSGLMLGDKPEYGAIELVGSLPPH